VGSSAAGVQAAKANSITNTKSIATVLDRFFMVSKSFSVFYYTDGVNNIPIILHNFSDVNYYFVIG
jgi:hypothetical protein